MSTEDTIDSTGYRESNEKRAKGAVDDGHASGRHSRLGKNDRTKEWWWLWSRVTRRLKNGINVLPRIRLASGATGIFQENFFCESEGDQS